MLTDTEIRCRQLRELCCLNNLVSPAPLLLTDSRSAHDIGQTLIP